MLNYLHNCCGTSAPSSSKPDQANPGLVENFNCYFFTPKEGIATKLWPKKVINYKLLFLKP